MIFEIYTIEDWNWVVKEILPRITHNILLMKGNLGAGKTTFTQFLLNELGSEDEVSSPTYSLVNEYHSPKGKVYHLDLYRLKSIEEVWDIGIDEYLEDAFLTIIEWPQIYEDELGLYPHHCMSIENNGNSRWVYFDED